MNKRELEKIRELYKELDFLKKQSSDIKKVHDSVKGSSPFYPYIEHIISIAGIDETDLAKRVKKLKYDLSGKIQQLMDKVEQAEKYIATVPDADTRIVLQCRYINGLTWEQIETEHGISWTTAHRKHRKWLDSQEA